MCKICILLLTVLSISACSPLAPINLPDEKQYVINKLPAIKTANHVTTATVLVLLPSTTPLYNTTAIIYSPTHYEMRKLASLRFSETPAEMLLQLLQQSLENSQRFKFVVTPPYNGSYQYQMSTHITQFYLDRTVYPAVFRCSLLIEWQNAVTQQLLISKRINASAAINGQQNSAIIDAANRAVASALSAVLAAI